MQLGFTEKDSSFTLVGHVPVLSRLVVSFLGTSKINSVSAQVGRSRQREVGLIVSGLIEQFCFCICQTCLLAYISL